MTREEEGERGLQSAQRLQSTHSIVGSQRYSDGCKEYQTELPCDFLYTIARAQFAHISCPRTLYYLTSRMSEVHFLLTGILADGTDEFPIGKEGQAVTMEDILDTLRRACSDEDLEEWKMLVP